MGWWTEPLRRWTEALAIESVVEYAPATSRSAIGQWANENLEWHIQLDEATRVRFPGWHPTDAMRDALLWTLFNSRGAQAGSADALDLDYRALLDKDVGELVLEMSVAAPIQAVSCEFWSYPGYLFLVRRKGALVDTDEAEGAWAQMIPEVLRAVLGEGWHRVLGERQDVIAYLPASKVDEAVLDAAEFADAECMTKRLESVAKLLVSAIAEDAYHDVMVSVSRRIEQPRQLYAGLVSAVLAARLQWPDNVRTAVYGDTLLPMFSALATQDAVEAFWQGLWERCQVPVDAWPEDWLEIVRGVISANLNISEAARILYVHRNTLIHKIDRLEQVTGYDVRNVTDAMILYFAALLKTQQVALN
ncbi:PucR family transcriptional regulator [Alicyclobacillus suci]|uniref:PucR family transcriptional regulator n=1 Tax=Alicyclobacillus suci TaxID=2816080 RepID=UPI001A90A4D1|nr:helix-turn-helix domain-containing protein [Alicyclobacillus suci]